MNYPVWDVAFGAGLLMAIVSILHVFVSHFAVGGGLFLVLTEIRAYRQHDPALLDWLKKHTKFFVLVTVVFGAVSGVGIWFTIALISPTATSNLIHAYVWGWAIEWIFFFLEITAALLYLYGWNKLEPKQHLWYGWIYFWAALASMVVINGIITFMLTPGQWIVNRQFWSGFFNPTFFPSLFIRFAFSLALAGIYALVTGTFQRDAELKARIVKWSAYWILPAFLLLPVFAFWYIQNIPAPLWASARGLMPTATWYASALVIFSMITFILSGLTLLRPKKIPFIFSLLIFGAALGSIGAFEFIREAVRKPFIIGNYLYGNSIYLSPPDRGSDFTIENLNQKGILNVARWIRHRTPAEHNQLAAGQEIFRTECQSCHTVDAYRGLKKYLVQRQWNATVNYQMLGCLDLMHNKVMPPFAGTAAEKQALTAFMAQLQPVSTRPAPMNGQQVYTSYCAACHQYRADNSIFVLYREMDPESIAESLTDLPTMFDQMPNLEITAGERQAFAEWIRQQFLAGRQ
ncbi:c-type cytochrome [candidate division KSB1 bacterium]|nr:c-type cytochrome [candidate division KSB1 bacterium]